ncbi:glycosyltransferase [Methanocalculus chunghsingensis]|uniref:glycosyltransferase n=1 Tax=Methanocalculus chunghsingensis TaxID=156457 RepID=UPI001B8CA684
MHIDAYLYVLPYVYESFPMTVLEAWAFHTPVIISESCALSATIDKKEAGIVFSRDPIDSVVRCSFFLWMTD